MRLGREGIRAAWHESRIGTFVGTRKQCLPAADALLDRSQHRFHLDLPTSSRFTERGRRYRQTSLAHGSVRAISRADGRGSEKIMKLACIGLFLAVNLAACGGETTSTANDESEEAASLGSIRIYEDDAGTTVSVKQGQSIFLYLDSNPTTGYDWVVTSVDGLGQAESKFTRNSNAIGAGGRERFKWTTHNVSGLHTLELAYKRSWEKSPIKTFKVTVNIKGAVNAVQLTDADNGKHFSVKEGQDVVVGLNSNPTTGYSWSVTSTDRSFGYPHETFEAPTTGLVGAGGVQKFVWNTNTPFAVGEHTVVLSYARGTGSAAQKFTFTVNVGL